MKKAKIILSAVAVLAIVGGAFAFKASKFTIPKLYYITGSAPTACSTHPFYNTVLGNTVTPAIALYTTFTTTAAGQLPVCTGLFSGVTRSTTDAQ